MMPRARDRTGARVLLVGRGTGDGVRPVQDLVEVVVRAASGENRGKTDATAHGTALSRAVRKMNVWWWIRGRLWARSRPMQVQMRRNQQRRMHRSLPRRKTCGRRKTSNKRLRNRGWASPRYCAVGVAVPCDAMRCDGPSGLTGLASSLPGA